MPVRSSAAVGLLAPFQPLDVISASSTTLRSDVFKEPHCRIRQIEADMKVLQGTPEHRVEAVAIQNASVRRQRTTADPLHAFTAQAVYGSFEEQREQGAGALLDEKIDNVPPAHADLIRGRDNKGSNWFWRTNSVVAKSACSCVPFVCRAGQTAQPERYSAELSRRERPA
jgi:hypothetical protein